MKKSLKQLVTVFGSEVTVSPIEIEIGASMLLDLQEIISRTPDHTFCIFLEWRLKYLVKWLNLLRLVRVTIEFLHVLNEE